MRTRIGFVLFIVIVLFSSCNWNIIDGEHLTGDDTGSGIDSTVLFTGEAPRNLRVSQAAYPDRITLSFSSVNHADYYNIYRAQVDSSYVNDGEYDDSLFWELIDIVPDTGVSHILYSDTNDLSSDAGIAYLYCVQAGNDYATAFLERNPEFSTVEKGWLLTAPSSITASQGTSPDYVEITWTNVEKVNGYDIEYSTDRINWTTINSTTIPPRSTSDTNRYFYYPSTSEFGKELYFRVISVQAQSESEPSVSRVGYTYVAGAPDAPTGVSVSRAEYSNKLRVSGDVSSREANTDGGYTWTIVRRIPGGEDETILTFNSLDPQAPNLVKTDSEYEYTDQSGLSPNVTYEYEIKASCDVQMDDGTIIEDALGESVVMEGFLLSPPVDFITSVNYSTGAISITVTAPLGYNSNRTWTYNVQGRFNDGSSTTTWATLESSVSVMDENSFSYTFSESNKYNEFQFNVSNGTETSIYSDIVAPDGITIGDFKISANNPVGTADSNGLYPVAFTASSDVSGVTLELEVEKADGTVVNFTIDASSISSDLNAMPIDYCPDEVFEVFRYRARKYNEFGRYTSWTSWQDGYGAITDAAYVKLCEKYVLKPWEFINDPTFPAELANDWKNNEIYKKISSSSTESAGEASANGHVSGILEYYANANIKPIVWESDADITLTYENFCEIEDSNGAILVGSGSWTMYGVGLDGKGDKPCTGTVTITGRYPGNLNFTELNIENKAFKGDYLVTQQWRKDGAAHVTATQNVF